MIQKEKEMGNLVVPISLADIAKGNGDANEQKS